MITTTLAVVALPGALNPSPAMGWRTDYAQAMAVASAEKKPMAVLIGHGADRINRLVSEGTISSESARLLRESYVSVYLDTETAAGKELAGRFALTEGLVISSPGGSVQALRHSGTVSGTELTRNLSQYAQSGQPTTTVSTSTSPAVISGAVVQTGYSAPIILGGCANGTCGAVYPAGNYVYPSGGVTYPPTYSAYPFGGGCPNGRCSALNAL